MAALLLACVTTAGAFAQVPSDRDLNAVVTIQDRSLTFEVATIKPISPGGMHMVGSTVLGNGTVQIRTASLKSLICNAFDLSAWQVSGLDQKTEKELYDIDAKPPEVSDSLRYSTRRTLRGIEDPRLRQMLQALLIDRFQMKFHRKVETGAVYLLERTGKKLFLKPSEAAASSDYPSGEVAAVGGNGWGLHDTSMPELASFLSNSLVHRPVLDRTELLGAFDFHSQFILTNEQFHDPDFMDTLKPVISEMGLKLVSGKGQVETFVVDYAAEPSPN